jgi:hypothetical protein
MMHFEAMERRILMDAQPGVLADLRMDTNRDGVINKLDNLNENQWTPGPNGHGAIILPNLDRDNTTTNAPDNWSGGVFNGKTVAPNHVIDNIADLADIGRIRLSKLNADSPYDYTLTIRLLKPADDPAWFADLPVTDRVRIFMPTKGDGSGNTSPQAGDVAVMGPGLADSIRFTINPLGSTDYSINDIAGKGGFFFGVEGITPGATVRIEATLEYTPIIADGEPPPPVVVNKDVVEFKVAPLVLLDNRAKVETAIVENMNPYSIDNAPLRQTLKQVFGDKLIESRSGDLWQQDGYEIGYVQAPYGQMPVVLELPRARDHFFDTEVNMRSFIRGTLLRGGVGVSTDLSASPAVDSSTYGGDIEAIARKGAKPGEPGLLLVSNMPQYMRDYFSAQGVQKIVDLPLEWLGVNHVDEVIEMSSGGKKVMIADPDVAWGLMLWATKIDSNVRGFAGMSGNDFLPDYTPEGIKLTFLLNNKDFRSQSLKFVQSAQNLPAVHDIIKRALKLTDEVTSPSMFEENQGTVFLQRAGVFTQMLGNVRRDFEVRFVDSNVYRLRYRDAGGEWSKWNGGRKDKDEVFPAAKAFILKNYWTGTAAAGDMFSFNTNPGATLLKMPVLFGTPSAPISSSDIIGPGGLRVSAFSVNHINSLIDSDTAVTGTTFGPKVNWNGTGASDLFGDYVTDVFHRAGVRNVVFADSTVYHNSGGSIHCGTNTIRKIPDAQWWEV